MCMVAVILPLSTVSSHAVMSNILELDLTVTLWVPSLTLSPEMGVMPSSTTSSTSAMSDAEATFEVPVSPVCAAVSVCC